MFGHLKKIFPASNINFKDITSAIGLNDEELRAKGLERIQAVKSEIQSLSAILTNRPPPSLSRQASEYTIAKVEEVQPEPGLSLVETTKLIQKFDAEYEEIKTLNQKNFHGSAKAEDLLARVLEHCKVHTDSSNALQQEVEHLDEMKLGLEEVVKHAVSMQGKLTKLAELMDALAKEKEERQFEEWKKQQEWDFQIYMAEKRRELENKKKAYDIQFGQHVKDQEKQRLQLIQANFEWDVQDFRKRKDIDFGQSYDPQLPSRPAAVSLENLSIDAPEDQRNALDQFLEDQGQPSNALASLRSIAAWDARMRAAQNDNEDEEGGAGLVAADEDYEG